MKRTHAKISNAGEKEPVAKRLKTIIKFGHVHGEERGEGVMDPAIEVEDNYYWLRDNEKKDKEILQHLEEENKYAATKMADTQELQDELYDEIRSRVKESDEGYPYPMGDGGWDSRYQYFSKTREGESYIYYCRRDMKTNKDEVILDVNEIAKGHTHCDVDSMTISDDHTIMAYAVDFLGDEKYEVVFKSLVTGEIIKEYALPEKISYGRFEWNSKKGMGDVYYTEADEANRGFRLWKYNLNDKVKSCIFEESDLTFSVDCEISQDGKYLFVTSHNFDTSEVYFCNISVPKDGGLRKIHPRTQGLRYEVEHHDGNFIIRTNKDNAVNFKLMKCPVFKTNISGWVDIKPHSSDEFVESFGCFKGFIAVGVRVGGFKKVGVIGYDDVTKKYAKTLQIVNVGGGERVGTVSFSTNEVYDTTKLRLSYTSFTQPLTLYEYDCVTMVVKVLKEREVPNYTSGEYESRLLFAPSYYGAKVPISLVYKKDLILGKKTKQTKNKKKEDTKPKPKQPQKLFLYGYGSYGHSIDPTFNHQIISLLDRGFIYAIAHVRGGSELGYQWYLDGKMHTKMNTFLDFISSAEYLIQEGYTKKELLVAEGRSAGGLLMGAVMTMRPDLFNTIVAVVPFVDALGTMADPTIPLTVPEWLQWGNPNKREDYVYMKQYSPYDNLKRVEYPNTLFMCGLNDNRVQYWEPAKFVAKLRHLKTDAKLHLFKTEMDQGHFGGSDRYRYIKETAFIYAFMLKTVSNF